MYEESVSNQANNVVSLTTHIRSNSNVNNDGNTSDDNLSDDVFAKAYKILYLKWTN